MMIILAGKVLVRFTDKGSWAEHISISSAQFNVVAGEEKYVSIQLAKVVTEAGKGEYVINPALDKGLLAIDRKRTQTGPVKKKHTGPTPKSQAR